MTILEKEVLFTCGTQMDKYFEDLGYIIPRYKDKQGRLMIKRGTKISVKVDDLPKNSGAIKLTKICDECGKHVLKKQSYQAILISRENGDGKDRCESCGYIKAGITKKGNIKYENSFEYHAKKDNKEHLLKEFSSKNTRKPNGIAYKSNDEFLWDCSDCKSEYSMKMSFRTSSDQNCPYCAGKRVNQTNCLWTTSPITARLLTDSEDGYKVTSGSGRSLKFTCPDCNFRQNKIVVNVVKQGFSCSKCSDGISYPEKFITDLLNQLNIEFEIQKIFNWSFKKRYDFYIKSRSMIIEVQGEQHYTDKGFGKLGGRGFAEEKENDEYKMKLAIMNGINNYVVLDCRESNMEYIKNSILNSCLNEIFNLDHIDFLKINEYACNSNLIKIICDLWNNGIKNTVEIGKVVKLERTTVSKYLKQGRELNWCDYDTQKVMESVYKDRAVKNKEKRSIKVVQLNKDGEYIRTWNSATDAGNDLGIPKSNITQVCKGSLKYKTSGGFKWMYKEDYDNLCSNS